MTHSQITRDIPKARGVLFGKKFKSKKANSKLVIHTNWLMLGVIGIAYIGGLFVPLMNNDSSHHANIALAMYESGDFVSLMDRGKDYLDKPHFLFWLSALSYKIFGVNSFAFKLSSFLFSILALYSTYKLAGRFYTNRIAELSSIILSTAYAFFLANNDVRMDAILTGSIIFSVWQLIIFVERKSYYSLFLSALGLSMGFATKGLIGIVMPVMTVFFFLAYKREWNSLLDGRWLLLLTMIIFFVSPIFYCFYVQFDLHPEKVIRGTTGNSGISFLLFGQSLQRYGGSGWGSSGNGDPFFFFHTLLWAFLPWSILAIVAVWRSARKHVLTKFKYSQQRQLFIPATLIVMLIILSGSQFKLPHYLNILFPFFALCTAEFIVAAGGKWNKKFRIIQYVMVFIIILINLILNFWSFPIHQPHTLLVSIILLVFFVFFYRKQYLTITLISTALLYFNMNFNFFPKLLQLQAGNVLAQTVKNAKFPIESLCYLEGFEYSNSFDFHAGKIIGAISLSTLKDSGKPMIVYTGPTGYEAINKSGISYQLLKSTVNLKVSVLDLSILDPAKRKNDPLHYLIQVN